MLRNVDNLDNPRDLYIVARIDDTHVYIRKSEKQWRRRVYKVKPDQLKKIMDVASVIPKDEQSRDDVNIEDTTSLP